MKKLFAYFKHYKKESLLAPLFKLLEACMDLTVPLVVAGIINHGISASSPRSIIARFFLLLLFAVLGLLFSFTAQFFAAKASVGFATELRQALFDHIQNLTSRELDRVGTDTLITRMTSDINQVQNGINLSLRLLLRSPFIVFGAMIMAFTIDIRCALIFACAIPLLSVVVFGIMAASIPRFRHVQQKLDRLLGTTRENLTGVRVIRAFCREDAAVTEFDEQNDDLTKMNESVGRLSALMNPATYMIVNIAVIILISRGAIRVDLGSLRQGDIVALYNYMAQITVELIKLASLIITINKSLACADRISGIFDITPAMTYVDQLPSESGSSDISVRFKDVFFTYEGSGAEAVSDIDFDVLRGQTVGIIGGTGSGKSTVISLIPRFYDVSSGSVEIDGINVKDYPPEDLRKKIAVVPQKAVLLSGTIRENLKIGNQNASDDDLWAALETAQAAEVVRNRDGQLDAIIEQNGRNLSGGQRQRLTIARALTAKPAILILDDSSSALDFATDLKLRTAIQKLDPDLTVFIVSQRTAGIRNADQILVLNDGEIVGRGTHDTLMSSCEIYQEIHYSQYPDERPGKGGESHEE